MNEGNSCFELSTNDIPFQKNIGLHTTTINSIKVTIPYQTTSRDIKGQSLGKIPYLASISILYQQTDNNQSAINSVLDQEVKDAMAQWELSMLDYLIDANTEPNQFYNDYFRPTTYEEIKLDVRVLKGAVIMHTIRAADDETNMRIANLFQQKQLVSDVYDVGTSFMMKGALGGMTHTTALFDYREALGWRKKSTTPRGLFPEMTVEDCRNYSREKGTIVAAKSRPQYWILCGVSMCAAYVLRHMITDTAIQRCLLTAGLTLIVGPIGAIVGLVSRF